MAKIVKQLELGIINNRRRKDFEKRFCNIKKYRKINSFLAYKNNGLLLNKIFIFKNFLAPVNKKIFQLSDYKKILNNYYFNNIRKWLK
ncbi:MAG: hypothetical protein ACP5JU_00645 [Minisyncoccia bacterium]